VVAKAGTKRTEYLLRTRTNPRSIVKAHRASMPQTRCTFLGNKFYLQPGINMRTEDHPESLRHPVLPNPTATRIKELPDKIQSVTTGGKVETTTYYQWLVEKNTQ